ncbi:RHS repeat domain-containing protein [Streptomyces althioticus]|uniref:RHS repeat domain-containing protein n=1 Tax=Streptomyces althioticus TaxID=83380 RepID=UPI003683428C
MAGYLAISLLGGPVAAAAELTLPDLKAPDPVPTAKVKPHKLSQPAQMPPSKVAPKAKWPSVGSTTVTLPEKGQREAGNHAISIGKSPRASKKDPSPGKAQVQVLSRATAKSLGVDGVVLAVRSADGSAGPVNVEVDYSGFRHAYGGDWASRLTFKQLPTCALTAPNSTNCGKTTELPARNDNEQATLASVVNLPATTSTAITAAPVTSAPAARSATGMSANAGTVLLAVTAAASGAAGDFTASPLAPSASWSAGGSSGAFTWSYDLDTPEVAAGPGPDLSLSYSSQAVDGRTAATNNQANWVGDGWTLDVGSIERRYIACSEDTTDSNGTDKSGDQCWKNDNAVLTLNGQSSVLIKDKDTGEWHLEDDDGTKIEKLADTARANGDDNGEYWRVTTPDGTEYHFGYNRLPGYSTGKTETNSTWTVPVFGNQSGEPCHATAYKDSWCQQAWRWNLDYVVTPHGDATAYYWKKEANYYGLNVNPSTGASTATVYDRGGYLERIEYGLRSNTVYTQKAAGQVSFTVAPRCLTDCDTFDSAHAKNWPDVPFDRYCAAGQECTNRFSPSFWTRERLTQIDTSILTNGAYKPVDTWKLTHQFPSTGDGTDPALWLASVTRTGHTGTGDVTLPTVTFMGQQLPNRVEGATTGGSPDPVPPLNRYRVYRVNTETGSSIGVTYSQTDCKAGDVPEPESNNRRCYPVIWSPPDAPASGYKPYLDWFHTYVATQILESDNTGGAPIKQTDYTYLGGMAWGKDEDEFTKPSELTYGDRQGYGRVQVRTGSPVEGTRSLEEHRYFRGIAGAKVTDHEGNEVTDHPAFAGMPREHAIYSGHGGTVQKTISYTPWRSAATATQPRTGLSSLQAYATGTAQEKTRTAVATGWRAAQINRTFDTRGRILTESDLGDLSETGDEECTTTAYASSSTGILDLPKEVKNVAVACGATPSLPADLISVARYYYDGATSLDTPATKGDITRLDEQDTKGTGYITAARHTYDQHGRELTDTNAANITSTTAYDPTTVEAPRSKSETNTLEQTVTTYYEPARGATTAVVDANGKRTDAVLDGLGRTLKVWRTGWSRTDHPDQPSTEFTYTISRTVPNAVATKTLQYDGTYVTSYQIYDGLLRERATQTRAYGTTNRIVTETKYNSRGLPDKTYSAYYAEGAPSPDFTSGAADNTVPAMVENIYDGQGRVTDAIARHFGDEAYRTKTLYAGDRTTVIPPTGGTATTTVTDVRGRTTELLQYTNTARTEYQTTRYTYGKYDEPDTITDPVGNTWRYTFDARGQKTDAVDPDKGTSHTEYDNLGNPTTTTDARGITLTTSYDDLGRKRTLKKGTTLLAEWTYDTASKGQLASSIRYINGQPYTTAITAYTDDYQPATSTVTIPAGAGALAGTYTWTYGYNTYTGAQEWIRHPAVGNLPSERQTTIYGHLSLPQKTTAGAVNLINATQYDAFSRVSGLEFGTLGKKVYLTRAYDELTGRMTRQVSSRDLAPKSIDDTTYTYDDAGNITSLTTASGQDTDRTVDTQCFTNDALQRLTQAWTTTTDCNTAPAITSVGGPEPYWHSYAYDAIGNRKKLTDHRTGATTAYTHNSAGGSVPHAPQTATVSGGPDNGQTSTFTYDAAGNAKTRTIGSRTQNLTWDDEGHLATLTEAGKTTSYLYDADGNRMVARDADGSQTLTLPGNNELKVTAAGVKEGTRYYTHGGETIAVRTSKGFNYLINDHQGTAMTAVAMTTLTVTRRRQLPFGQLRSEQTESLPGTRGFVNGTEDSTGLIHIGAREYDPSLGSFISVDPLIDITDPLQMNAYAYANSRPVTASDPDGQMIYDDLTGKGYGNAKVMKSAYKKYGYLDSKGRTTKKYKKKLASEHARWNAYTSSSAYKWVEKQTNDYYANSAKRKAQPSAQKQGKSAEEVKQDGWFDSIKKGVSGAWNKTGGKVVSAVGDHFSEHWRDWAGNGALLVGAAGVMVCIASVVCGIGGVVAIGAGSAAASYVGFNAGTKNWNNTSFVMSTATGAGTAYIGGSGPLGSSVKSALSMMRLNRSLGRIERSVNKMKDLE